MQPAGMATPFSQLLLEDVRALPLWVKQLLFSTLYQQFVETFTAEAFEIFALHDLVAAYRPQLTSQGQHAVAQKKVTEDLALFLQDCAQGITILDSCLQHTWSLKDCCGFVMEALDQGWLTEIESHKVLGTVAYMANRIRLGEYLVKMDRLRPEQLDQALRTQHYVKEAFEEHTRIANVLINLGYITRKDAEALVFLKQESTQPLEKTGLLAKYAGIAAS